MREGQDHSYSIPLEEIIHIYNEILALSIQDGFLNDKSFLSSELSAFNSINIYGEAGVSAGIMTAGSVSAEGRVNCQVAMNGFANCGSLRLLFLLKGAVLFD